MILNIKTIPNAKKNKIIEEDGVIKIYITAQPEKGKANKALIKFLAKYYNIPKSSIKINKGETNTLKQIEIIGKK